MMWRVYTLGFAFLLLGVGANGYLESLRIEEVKQESATLCSSYPLPVANASTVLSKLGLFLDEAAGKISAVLREDKSPGGVVVSVVYNDTVIWTKGFGLINDSDPDRGPPDSNTAFRIGSITKVFTTLMTLMLRDAGSLRSIDEDITDYLPQFKIQNPFQTARGITFRQLMSHMSGLPRNPPCPGLFTTGCNLTDQQIYSNAAQLELMFPPGDQPAYSNFGFGLLGRVLEKIKGPTWEGQLQDMVLTPLRMNNSGNTFTPATTKNLSVGYFSDGTVADLIDIGWDAPAGQMYASTHDLAQLMKMLFQPEQRYSSTTGQILDGETIREWMQPAYKYADGTGFGYPWELKLLGNYTLRTKDGRINGYQAEFQMAHEIKTGFIFLQSCDDCTSHVRIIPIAQQIILEVNNILSSMQPGPSMPPIPAEYVGSYVGKISAYYVDIANVLQTTIHGQQVLLILQGGYSTLLVWTGGDTFQISVQGFQVPCFVLGAGHIGERVYFQRNPLNIVTSLTLPGLAYDRVYTKEP